MEGGVRLFRAASRTLEKESGKLLALPNVVGVGIGYKTVAKQRTKDVAVVVFVEKKTLLRDLEKEHRIPKFINSVMTDVVEIGKVRFFSNNVKARPAKPGHSIGHYLISSGTFGAVVLDIKTKKELILSNNHVLANLTNGRDDRSQIGDPILQPGTYDGGTEEDEIATLERFVPVVSEEDEPTSTWALRANNIMNKIVKLFKPDYEVKISKKGKFNLVDCAVAAPIKKGSIVDDILEIGRVKGINSALPNQYVKKSGRSSGLTQGYVIAVNVSLKVNIGEGEEYLFADQIVSDMQSLPGDSGSLVLDQDNKAIGLLFAGSDEYTIINKIQNVMKVLQIEFKPYE